MVPAGLANPAGQLGNANFGGWMRFLKKIYQYWLAFGHAIGVVMAPIQLMLVYVLVFGPARLVTLIGGKDLLDRRMTPSPSYWHAKESEKVGLEEARRQF